jgi:hypothetical protein
MPAWASGWSVDSSMKTIKHAKTPFLIWVFYFGIVFDFFVYLLNKIKLMAQKLLYNAILLFYFYES